MVKFRSFKVMESFAYLQLALVWEAPTESLFFEGLNWKKLSSQIYIHFLCLAVLLSVLSLASSALALTKGERNSQVTALQQALQSLGYFNTGVTDYYGSVTEEAVRQFQRDRGLSVDGIAGPATLAALGLGRPASQIFNPGGNTAIRAIGYGETSSRVKSIQQRLKVLNYFDGPITGYFGSLTREAVIRFQEDSGLPRTGEIDSRTLYAINVGSPSSTPFAPGCNVVFKEEDRGPSV